MGSCFVKKTNELIIDGDTTNAVDNKRELIRYVLIIWSNDVLIDGITDIILKYAMYSFNINEWNVDKERNDYFFWGQFYFATNKLNSKYRIQVKLYDKNKPNAGKKTVKYSYMHETQILTHISHENVLHCVGFYEDKTYYYIAFQYHYGPLLYDYVNDVQLNENLCKLFVKDMLKIYKYLESINIYHCELKPESYAFYNEMSINMNYKDYNNRLLLKNFENALIINDYNKYYKALGTTAWYCSPEIAKGWINKKYKFKGHTFKTNDMYSIGIITYAMLYRSTPYIDVRSTDGLYLMVKTVSNQWEFKSKDAKGNPINLTQSCKDFISKLLITDPKKRINIDNAIKHPWILNNSQ